MIDLVPVNFFLFNSQDGGNRIVADELVRTALHSQPGHTFDRLAVFALNLSLAGSWHGARPEQRYPAEWAKHFIVERVCKGGRWDGSRISTDDIEAFIKASPDYRGAWAHKAATNLNYIYELAGSKSFVSGLAEPWWGSAIYLAIERLSVDRDYGVPLPAVDRIVADLADEHVFELSAVPTADGMIAAKDIVEIWIKDTRPTPQPSQGQPSLSAAHPHSLGLSEKSVLPVERVFASASRQVRDQRIVRAIRDAYEDKCAVCGQALRLLGTKTYCEVGHIKPVGLPFRGPDHHSNVLPFCPNHHRQFDRGAVYFEIEGTALRAMDRSGTVVKKGRQFIPLPKHNLDLTHVQWHADYFLQR